MSTIPSISSQIDEKIIFKVIDKHFSRLAPHYYKWINAWMIGAYENYADIDKYIILIYIINKDFIFFRRNGLIVDYDSFYKDKSLEVDKINISDISKDLQIPKESVRRKVEEQEKIAKIAYQSTEISDSIKKNFSFVWYQFYKFIFIFTNRWRKELGDLETFTIGVIVLINAVENKNFKVKEFDRKKYSIKIQGSDERGVNAMSLAEITGIPRSTVVRKLKSLIKKDLLQINEKNLITVNMKGESFKTAQRLQDKNMLSLSNFISRVFNQLKITN